MALNISKEENGILRLEIIGTPEGTDLLETLDAAFCDTDFQHIIWDLRKGSVSAFSPDQFGPGARLVAKYASKRGPNPKTAVLCKNHADVLHAKAFGDLAGTMSSVAFRPFTDEDALLAWLTEDV